MLHSKPHDLTTIPANHEFYVWDLSEGTDYTIVRDLANAVKLAVWPMIQEFLEKEAIGYKDRDAQRILETLASLKPTTSNKESKP